MAAPTVLSGQWGYFISASSGTGNVQVLADPKLSLRICGIAAGGTATNDIVTLYDGNSVPVFTAVGSTIGANVLATVQLASTIRVTGPSVTFAGGTSGV